MISLKDTTRLRAVAVWLCTNAALAGLLRWVGHELGSPAQGRAFDDVLERACLVALALCGVWAWLIVSAVVLEVLQSRPIPTSATKGVPPWARRLVLVACGVVVIGLATPASAQDADIDGLPMPDRSTGGFLTQSVRPLLQATHQNDTSDVARTPRHVVAPGESLWSIAEAELGNPTRWTEIYHLNRAAVGSNPDLIDVAQRLDLPPRPAPESGDRHAR